MDQSTCAQRSVGVGRLTDASACRTALFHTLTSARDLPVSFLLEDRPGSPGRISWPEGSQGRFILNISRERSSHFPYNQRNIILGRAMRAKEDHHSTRGTTPYKLFRQR